MTKFIQRISALLVSLLVAPILVLISIPVIMIDIIKEVIENILCYIRDTTSRMNKTDAR